MFNSQSRCCPDTEITLYIFPSVGKNVSVRCLDKVFRKFVWRARSAGRSLCALSDYGPGSFLDFLSGFLF